MSFDEYTPPARKDADLSSSSPIVSDADGVANIRKVEEKDRRNLVMVAVILFAVGVAILWFCGIQPARIREAAKSWPEVPAVVEKSQVRVTHHEDHDSDRGGLRTYNTYSFDISYHYSFNGADYRSSRMSAFCMTVSSSDDGAAQNMVQKYPVGSKIKVYVNPSDPAYAIIERNGGGSGFIVFIFVLIPAAIGGLFLKIAMTAQYMMSCKRIDRRGRTVTSVKYFDTIEEAQAAVDKQASAVATMEAELARLKVGIGRK